MKAFDDSTATNTSLLLTWAYRVLRPIVRILRSAGVSESQLIDCVARAAREHSGDPPKGHLGSGTRRDTLTALAEITAHWTRSAEWTDEAGRPRELSLRAGDPKGFAALVRAIEPRLSATTALEQLRRLDVVRLVRNDQCVRLLTHVVLHAGNGTFPVEAILADLRRFAETLEYNIFLHREGEPTRMQRLASRMSLDPARFADFERFVRGNGQMFLESADDVLGTYVTKQPDGSIQFGVGLFIFLDEASARTPTQLTHQPNKS